MGLNSLVFFYLLFSDVISTIYLISYYTLNFSLLFIVQGGKVSCFSCFFNCSREGGALLLFILIFFYC